MLEQKICRHCLEHSATGEDMLTILKGASPKCSGCPEQPVMQMVTEQFQAQRPRWWQIKGKMVIPVWLVERIKHLK